MLKACDILLTYKNEKELNMYAVVKTGGKQYKVAPGDILKVEKLEGIAGDTVDLSQVLMIGEGDKISVGAPLLEKAIVRTTILEQKRARKIIVFKMRRRQGYRRKHGHRQPITVLRIEQISADGKLSAAPAPQKAVKKTVDVKKETSATKKVEPKAEKASAEKKAPAVKKAAPAEKKSTKK